MALRSCPFPGEVSAERGLRCLGSYKVKGASFPGSVWAVRQSPSSSTEWGSASSRETVGLVIKSPLPFPEL